MMPRAALSTRQAQVAEYVAKGLPDKVIARETGLSVKTVQVHVQLAAAKIPGHTSPRHKLTLWVYGIDLDDPSDAP